MKKKNEELKILVITTKNGMKREIRKMIEGRVMRLEFKKVKNIRDIPSKQFLRNDLLCLPGKIDTTLVLTLYKSHNGSQTSMTKDKNKKTSL